MFSSTATGAARRAFELHRRMPEDLEFVAFMTADMSEEWRSGFPGFKFVEIGDSRSLINRLREGSGSLWRGLLQQHGCGLWVTDTLPVPRSLSDRKTCITIHDLRFLTSRNYVDLKRYLLMKHSMGRSLKRADSVIAVSQWTGRVLMDRYPVTAGKLSVVENAVDPLPYRNAGSAASPFGRPYMLSVGHLETRKNFVNLVEAFGLIAGAWDGILVLVGRDQGSLGSILETASRLNVLDRLIVRHDVDFGTLVRFYGNCEMLICPSRYEGFGITLLEGMAAGRPVVASDIPPHREVAGEAALYADPDDIQGLATLMLKVARDKELQDSMIQMGRDRLDKFSWQRSAGRLAALYRELLGR